MRDGFDQHHQLAQVSQSVVDCGQRRHSSRTAFPLAQGNRMPSKGCCQHITLLTLRKTRTSSNCLSRKKQLAMAWRPGMVSHSVGLEPTSWKYCCAALSCSWEPDAWPRLSCTTAYTGAKQAEQHHVHNMMCQLSSSCVLAVAAGIHGSVLPQLGYVFHKALLRLPGRWLQATGMSFCAALTGTRLSTHLEYVLLWCGGADVLHQRIGLVHPA